MGPHSRIAVLLANQPGIRSKTYLIQTEESKEQDYNQNNDYEIDGGKAKCTPPAPPPRPPPAGPPAPPAPPATLELLQEQNENYGRDYQGDDYFCVWNCDESPSNDAGETTTARNSNGDWRRVYTRPGK